MLLNCWRVPLPSSPNSAQHAIPLLIPLHFICIFFSLASLNLIHILWVHLNSLSYQFFYSIWNSPSDAELLFGFSSVFAHVVPGNCCCAVKPGKHVIWPNTWLADLRHCSLHCRWRYMPQAPYAEPGMCFVPYGGTVGAVYLCLMPHIQLQYPDRWEG